jgi:hypothetical protein
MIVLHYAGADPAAPLHAKTTGVFESRVNSTSATTAAFNTVAASEVIVVCASTDGGGSTFTGGPGYTVESTEITNKVACED